MSTHTEEMTMIRELTSHKVNGLNECIKVEVLDEPGPGGANHQYRMSGVQGPLDHHPIPTVDIRFQNGPINEVGANGLSQEALLAIVEDRLAGFQGGEYATSDNGEALDHVRAAMECLHRRTKERMGRGVEGTMGK